MKYIISLMLLCLLTSAAAIMVVDREGHAHEYPYESWFRIQEGEFTTSKEVDKETVTQTWKGIRFDHWLAGQGFGDFQKIRFVSGDRYEVVFNRAEWDTLTCWLAFSEEGKIFPREQLRVIFPHLRSQYWVRDLAEVRLEEHKEIAMPVKFMPMEGFLDTQSLVADPKPFVRMQGYRFDEFLPTLSDEPIKNVVLYSKDGLTQMLSYPGQLAGAVLELTKDGSYNLKSPQIPGGMWMKDIVYLQCDAQSLIHLKYISSLISISKILDWNLSSAAMVKINYPDSSEEQNLGDAFAEPMIFEGIRDFQIFP